MDGIHDLSGKQGYGPIDVGERYEPLPADWQARVLGIVRAIARPADWSIDWFRHCRELIDPVDYLTRPYYDQWLQAYEAMMVNSGVATVAELASGKSRTPVTGLPAPMAPDDVDAAQRVSAAVRPRRLPGAGGDAVRTNPHGIATHTRLPAYVRGRRGIIEAVHGAHVLPDANARGQEQAEPLYTVAFAATELWTVAHATASISIFGRAILIAPEALAPLASADDGPTFGESWHAQVLAGGSVVSDDMLSLPKRRVIGWRELPVAAQDAIVARASRSYVGSDWLRDAIAGAVRRDPRATEWSPRWQRGRK